MNQPQKSLVKKKKNTKRQFSKLPTNLPNYNYEAFNSIDIKRAFIYFQNQLEKLEKVISNLKQVSKSNDYNSSTINNQINKDNINNVEFVPQSPKVVPLNSYNPEISLETPFIGKGITPKAEVYETLQRPLITDESSNLESKLKNLLNPNN